MRSILSISDLSEDEINYIFDFARGFLAGEKLKQLSDKLLINLFFEYSTRTSSSFEIAAKKLGIQVVNINVADSAMQKGETAIDTVKNLDALGPDFMVIRHNESGGVKWLAKYANCSVINAGDGSAEHPTQALLDAFTILQAKKTLKGLKIAICGDILHSRVARSDIILFELLGAEVCLVAPPPFALKQVKTYYSMEEGLKEADVIIMLRLQKERIDDLALPAAYLQLYGLNKDKLKYAKPDVMVMHPGPVGAEISADIASGFKNNFILEQVKNGVAVRAGLISLLAEAGNKKISGF
jgi:aspartate carbamoyltransferase catalytic subunit